MLVRSLAYARLRDWLHRWRFKVEFDPEWDDSTWFSLSGPIVMLYTPWGSLFLRLWNAFNKVSTEGHYWGVGLLQIGHRHLFAVMFSGVSIAFIGRIP
jgi:hypothetical protein